MLGHTSPACTRNLTRSAMDDPHADIMQGYNNRADPDILGINFTDFIAWLIKPNPGPYMCPHCSTLA